MMATHPRTEKRNALKARLMDLPITADRVEIGRTRPLGRRHDPTLLIYTPSDQQQRGEPTLLEFVVEGRTNTADVPDDLLDAIDLEVDGRLFDAEDELGLFDIMRIRTEIETSAEGERHLGKIKMTYAGRYYEPDEPE